MASEKTLQPPLHQDLILYSLHDCVVVAPSRPLGNPGNVPDSVLVIQRQNGSVDLRPRQHFFPMPPTARKRQIFGILGMIGGSALVVITRKIRMGQWPIMGAESSQQQSANIWRLEAAEIVHLNESSRSLQTESLQDSLIQVLALPYFYFCYEDDVTQTRQRSFTMTQKGQVSRTPFDLLEKRFVWNFTLLKTFFDNTTTEGDRSNAFRFAVPLIHGAVFINKCSINGKEFDWCIVSRRANKRVGTRFFVRGCDDEGHVANFVETEQIISYEGTVSSFVQTRGSIPMFWTQTPTIKYKPKPKLIPEKDQISGLMRHFSDQIPLYGEQVIVNLIDQKKSEGELEVHFKNTIMEANLKNVRYVPFDFHTECKGMRYDRLSKLIGNLKRDLTEFEYFFHSSSRHPEESLKLQKGVFRTNCMDCLDRTNVVQSLLSAENLKIVLVRLGVLKPTDDTNSGAFDPIFRNTWADHANLISVQYAGTGALKTDFTRTGKRSYQGLIQDGWNSLVRYYFNNFTDGTKTDNLRLLVGETSYTELFKGRKRLQDSRNTTGPLEYCPLALEISLAVLALLLITTKEADTQFFALFLLTVSIVGALGHLIVKNGKHLVRYPASDFSK